MRRSRKAQIPLGEVVLVLIVFFVIAGAAGTIYMQTAAKNDAARQIDNAFYTLADTTKDVTGLYELRYGVANRNDATIIDIERAKSFKTTLDDATFHNQYRERFAGYTISITCVYPHCVDFNSGVPLILLNYTAASAKNFMENRLPIVLYDPVSGDQSYGLLVVRQAS